MAAGWLAWGRPAAAVLAAAGVLLLWSFGLGVWAGLVVLLLWSAALAVGPVGARVVVAAVVLTAAASTWVLVTTLVGAGLLAPCFAALAAGIGAYAVRIRRPEPSWDEVVSAGFLLLTGAWAVWVVNRADTAGRMAGFRSGEDNASHLSILSGVLRAGGYLYRDSGPAASRVFEGLRDYPQGLHASAAVWAGLADGPGRHEAVAAIVSHYAVALTLVTALAALAVAEAAGAMARRLGARGAALAAPAVLSALAFLAGPLGLLETSGYFSQLAGYVGLSALVLASMLRRGEPTSPARSWLRLTVAVAGLVVVSGSWYFLLPVALLAAAVVVGRERQVLLRRPVLGGLLACGTAAACAPHIVNSLLAGAGSSLNAPGGVVPVGRGLLYFVVVASLLLTPLLAGRWLATGGWSAAWVGAMGFSLLLREYQLGTAGTTSYYYEKSLYTVLLLSIVALGALSAVLLDRASPDRNRDQAVLSTVAALLLGSILLPPSQRPGTLLDTLRRSPPTDERLAVVLAQYPDQRAAPLLAWGGPDLVQDYLTNRLLGAVYGQDDEQRWRSVSAALAGQDPQLLVPLLARSDAVLVTPAADLSSSLSRAGLPPELLARIRTLVLP